MDMMKVLVDGSIFLNKQKEKLVDKVKEAFLDETGAVDIVAIVVLIGIAVVLAVVFKNQISAILTKLFGSIGKNAENAITPAP